jgi:prepilin-type N-terminal cleavage/methylation domain-containing protein
MQHRSSGGFTLVEVLVALVVVALGLAALMVAVQGAARTSGYLRDKTLAQWIALNRIAEVRLTANKTGTTAPVAAISTLTTSSSTSTSTPTSSSNFSSTSDTGEVQFGGRTWHYDTRYFNTNFPDMKRIVVRVWAGDAKTKSSPITETTSFYGTSLGQPGLSNTDWTVGTTVSTALCPQNGTAAGGPNTGGIGGGVNPRLNPGGVNPGFGTSPNCPPAAGTQGVMPVQPTPGLGIGTPTP